MMHRPAAAAAAATFFATAAAAAGCPLVLELTQPLLLTLTQRALLLLLLLLLQIVPLVLELTHRAADRMSQHDSFDITDAAKRITSDVMGHLLYGEDLRGTHWE
jgi:hypothetical protein